MNNDDKKLFNPTTLLLSDFKTPEEYKNAFFVQNIVNTSEYYELQIFQQYFVHGFLSIKNIFKASKELSQSDKSEITYRKVNDWSSKELFEENRNTNIEWRKYSVKTGVQLLLINDLKRYGYSNEQIKKIINQVIYDSCDVLVDNSKFNYSYFDFYASTFYKRGISFSLVIDSNCDTYCFCEKDLSINIAKGGLAKETSLLILLFSKYLSVFAEYVFHRNNEKAITDDLSGKTVLPTDNEQKIIEKVRDTEINNININRKSRNKSLIMKSLKTKQDICLTDRELLAINQVDKHTKVTTQLVKDGVYNITTEKTEKLD